MPVINPAKVIIDDSLPISELGKKAAPDNSFFSSQQEKMVRHRQYDSAGKLLLEKRVRKNDVPILSAAAPTGVSPTAQVVLTYTNVDGVTSHEIQKSTDGGVTWIAGVPATDAASPVTETGLSSGVIRFRIRGTYTKGNGEWSNTVDVTVP